jgi:hypothetical protein
MELTSGLLDECQRLVLAGPEGVGKSTLASLLPKPGFIDVEGSTADLNVVRTPKPASWTALVDMTTEFLKDHHGLESLVIDTADYAERMCVAHILASNGMTSLGGEKDFGRSYNLLETEWCRWLDLLSRVAKSGMHVILVAHVGVKNVRTPDVDSSYDRYELKMEKKTSAATKEWARNMLFLAYKTYIVEDKGKKKGTGGHRVIYTTRTPAWDAKNRAGLPEELPLEYKSIAKLFERGNKPAPVTVVPPTKATSPPVAQQEKKPVEPVALAGEETKSAAHLLPLVQLMNRDKVSEREIQLAVAKRGYYPADTPLEVYDPQFVAGRLVAYWPKVLEMVEAVRKEISQ